MDDDDFLDFEYLDSDEPFDAAAEGKENSEDAPQATFQSYTIEMVGNVLLSLQADLRVRLVDWATRLVIQMTSELLQTSRKLPKYTSERLRDDPYLDIDLDGTIEQYIVDPQRKSDAVRVFKRSKTGHSVLLIIDSSYSMSGQKIVMAAAAAATICHLFEARDIAVVHFGTKGEIVKSFDEEVSAEALVEQIFALIPKGFTNVYAGLKVGLDELGARKQYRFTAILLSDCDTNTGKIPSIIAWKLRGLKIITIPPSINDFMANLIARESRGEIFEAEKVMDIPIILKRIFDTN
ncbi:MAG: vWA domain-containing protein [Candidatus Hodarchaeales archaeon]|jgi:Mg-chelatase subunit ChlD